MAAPARSDSQSADKRAALRVEADYQARIESRLEVAFTQHVDALERIAELLEARIRQERQYEQFYGYGLLSERAVIDHAFARPGWVLVGLTLAYIGDGTSPVLILDGLFPGLPLTVNLTVGRPDWVETRLILPQQVSIVPTLSQTGGTKGSALILAACQRG